MLYDHYHGSVYRFPFYRTGPSGRGPDLGDVLPGAARHGHLPLAGQDFGAWLMTIARNLDTDHYKAGRPRLEMTTEDMGQHDDGSTEGPRAPYLPADQRDAARGAQRAADRAADCLVMRFLQGLTHRRDRRGARSLRGRGQAAPAARRPQPRQADADGIRGG